MEPKEIACGLARVLDSKKAQQLSVIDTFELTSLSDFFVICTGTSPAQIKALSDACEKFMDENELPVHHIEGHRGGTWVLLDYGAVIVHIFTEESRAFYDLDKLWCDATEVDLSDILVKEGE